MVEGVVHQQQQAPHETLSPSEPAQQAPAALELLQRARNAAGDARIRFATELNAMLRGDVANVERISWAQFLLDKLDDEAFHDLFDAQGTPCRAAAVEAVLTMGFPWALHVEPDDLDYLRAVKPIPRPTSPWAAMAVITGLLAVLFTLAFFSGL